MKISEYTLGEYKVSVYEVTERDPINYIRSSELASILKASKHKKYIDILYSKIYGITDEITKENLEGRILESLGIDLLNYYDTDTITTYKNKINNLAVRTVFKENRTFKLVLSDYIDEVTIMVSPDAYIVNIEGPNTPVDIKRMSTWSYQGYMNSGLMNNYVWQLFCQMLVYGSEVGHLFIMEMKDNGIELHMDSLQLQPMLPYLSTIIKECKLFYEKVEYYRDKEPELLLKEEGDITQISDNILNLILDSSSDKKDSVLSMDDERLMNVINSVEENSGIKDIEQCLMEYMEKKNNVKEIEEYFEKVKKSFQMNFPEYSDVTIDTGQDYLIKVSLRPFRVSLKNK